ncbi:helix-turn-helix domain-containing protein [Aquimarina sp. M1]
MYSLSFKLKVLEAMDKDLVSFSQACIKFNIPTKSAIRNWQRNYKKEVYPY